ncbi:hypothetical protein B0H10DRAFT_2244029 [Mycena sp. CBHHK59/15]|nr:hypothetical protein B0H10DRAFT_2244029 [Mycena sp. CBHHK59/15]
MSNFQPVLPSMFYPDPPRQSTPPNASNPTSTPNTLDTPICPGLSSSFPYSSMGGEYIEEAFVHAAHEMRGKYTLVDVKTFLNYLPNPSTNMPSVDEKSFAKVPSPRETEMYKPLISALRPFLKPGWTAVDTSNSADPNPNVFMGHSIKPDITIYSDQPASNNNLCRASDMECFIEVKTSPMNEPFGKKIEELEKPSGFARDTRGQLATYFAAMQAAQHRTHSFGVIVVGETCRLLRHTRSGTTITKSFKYASTTHLQSFFWRLSHAGAEKRGTDVTFARVAKGDQEHARALLRAQDYRMYRVTVGNHEYFVVDSFTRNHLYPVGRGTRCFVAVHSGTFQKCLLKDTWRLAAYHAEGEVYKQLHHHAVPNIPGVLDSGDVGHECGYPPDGGWSVPANATIREHIHYRIVFDVVGEPLSSFKSTHNLVSCVRDAFEAHHIAYTVAKVDHRDISVGNILAVEKQGNYHGLLIDWELARFQGDQISRAYERTGTRQFMAARLFDNPAPTRNVGDDIESFVLLLFWIAVRYAPNNSSEKQRTSFLNQFEDPEAKRNLILGYRQSAQRLQLESSQFRTFLVHIALQYTYRYDQPISLDDRAEVEELAAKQLALEKHDWLLDIFKTDLNDEAWKAIKDPARDNAIERVEAVKKRKADAGTEYAIVDKNKRRRGGERGPEVVDNASSSELSEVPDPSD